jgi:hypothetical protein
MAHDVISTCPVCQGELSITRLHCRTCGTALEGEFGVGRFGRLEREQLAFLQGFLRARGNLKELERELGISYPTVRGRLEGVLRALGLSDGSPESGTGDELPAETDEHASRDAQAESDRAGERREVLERLARHELSAEDAARTLRDLGRS